MEYKEAYMLQPMYPLESFALSVMNERCQYISEVIKYWILAGWLPWSPEGHFLLETSFPYPFGFGTLM